MKMKLRFNTDSRILAVVAPAMILLAASSPAPAQPQYQIIDLGTLGGSRSYANGISENGIVAGWATLPSGRVRAVLWDQSGAIVDMGDPLAPPGYICIAAAVNNSSQVAGYGEASPQAYQGYSWESGVWTPIGVLPGHSESIARDIGSVGRIVGSSFILGHEHRAVMWDGGVLTDLGTLGDSSNAYGINDVGQVVGYSLANLPGGEQGLRGFLWENGQMTALDPLPGEVATEAYDVNDAGDVVGSSWWYTTQFFSAKGATLWRDGGVAAIDLGYVPAPPGSCSLNPYWHKSIARAINNCGQVVGDAMCITSGASQDGFLWQDGVMYNLNDLIPSGTGWDFLKATDINDAGQIVGIGLLAPNDQYLRAYLLEPLTPRSCIPGDLDVDRDVDLDDFEILAGCIAGPEMTVPPPACDVATFGSADLDGDVDFPDFAKFQLAFTGPDTTSPTAPMGLTAALDIGSVNLDWDHNSEIDLAGYRVYRSTTAGGPYAQLSTSPIETNGFADTAIVYGATYYYVVTAVDASDNESTHSDEVSATPRASVFTHVQSIVLSVDAQGGDRYGVATVTIFDNLGHPVADAVVTGTFSGDFNGMPTETTDATGTAVLILGPTNGQPVFTFCVNDVVHATLTYDPATNLETCDAYP
ncbi:MAG: DUF3466 family protein [bacterium]|nr:DUF3466 family protein [bacterium]